MKTEMIMKSESELITIIMLDAITIIIKINIKVCKHLSCERKFIIKFN